MGIIKALIVSAIGHVLVFSATGLIAHSGTGSSQKGDVLFVELKNIDESNAMPDKRVSLGKNVVKESAQVETPEKVYYPPSPNPSRQGRGDTERTLSVSGEDIYQPSPLVGEPFIPSPLVGEGEGERQCAVLDGKGDNYSALLREIRDAIASKVSYPLIARKRNIQGTVLAGFSINEKGMPEDIRILESSGYSILDNEAIRTIKRAVPYPYIKWTVEVPVRFKLKEER
ncbi:MAG: energy transducer TonB [Nitrospirae bacterium]|nr:energy transducer TonB [Nitrospirota bacterium]